MRTSNKTIMMVLGVGAVLALAGQASAQSRFSHGRDGYRGGFDSRSSYGHSGFDGRPSYGHRGFGGGFGGGFVESPRSCPSPRVVVVPRVITPGWTSYGCPVYVWPPCGIRVPVFAAPLYQHHRYAQPTWQHYRR
jgi:hypothetical protein